MAITSHTRTRLASHTNSGRHISISEGLVAVNLAYPMVSTPVQVLQASTSQVASQLAGKSEFEILVNSQAAAHQRCGGCVVRHATSTNCVRTSGSSRRCRYHLVEMPLQCISCIIISSPCVLCHAFVIDNTKWQSWQHFLSTVNLNTDFDMVVFCYEQTYRTTII